MSDVETTFFPNPEPIELSRISEKTGASIKSSNTSDPMINNIAPLHEAKAGDITFIDNPKYLDALAKTQATACFCAPKYTDKMPEGVIALETPHPYMAFGLTARLFYPQALKPIHGIKADTISEQAYIASSAKIEEGVTIEAFAYIDEGAEIGENCYIASGARIGTNVKIGRNCSISSNAVIQHALIGDGVILHPGVKIGQDGFGYAMSPQGHLKTPQIGRVVIQDDVEIGANSVVDRGAIRDTIIGEGTKIDNLVQIAHNVVIGRHCIIVSQVGISGSTTLEDFVAIGGQAGLNGHITVGMGAQIAGASGVKDDIPAGEQWVGIPAKPARAWLKEQLCVAELSKRPKKQIDNDEI